MQKLFGQAVLVEAGELPFPTGYLTFLQSHNETEMFSSLWLHAHYVLSLYKTAIIDVARSWCVDNEMLPRAIAFLNERLKPLSLLDFKAKFAKSMLANGAKFMVHYIESLKKK